MIGGVAVVALASCSGDGDTAAPATTAPTTAAPRPSTTLRPVEPSFTGQNNAQFCATARTYNERSGSVSRATTPDQLRAGVRESRDAINQIAAAAPAEIKADAQTLANGFGVLFTELEKANFDPTRVALTAFAPMQAAEFVQSTTRFQAYMRTVCGIG
jgi:hypothetical protein